jgi:hypothetical protein
MNKILGIILFLSTVLAQATETIESIYSAQIKAISEKAIINFATKNPPIVCLETERDPNYIGLWHSLEIKASMQSVADVLEHFENYSHVFEDVKEARLVHKNGDNLLVEFENKSPVFFLPNIHYQMDYVIKEDKSYKLYKFVLAKAYKQNNIFFSDGLILLTSAGYITQYYELDFFKANWGLVEKFASSKIWEDSVKGILLSDVELKLKSENNTGDKATIDEKIVKECVKHKINARSFR